MKLGTKIKPKDRKGNDIHIGDTLSFDPGEWGGENIFVLEFDEDQVQLDIGFPASDLTDWCEVVKRWDGRQSFK